MIEGIDTLKVDEKDFIINETSFSKIKEPFLSKVNWALLNYVHCPYNNAMNSAYLLGDIPRGLGSDKSNINLLIVLHKGNKNIEQYLNHHFSKIKNDDIKLSVKVICYDDVFGNSYGSLKYKFIIKTISICVFGEDASSKIRQYTSKDMANLFDL